MMSVPSLVPSLRKHPFQTVFAMDLPAPDLLLPFLQRSIKTNHKDVCICLFRSFLEVMSTVYSLQHFKRGDRLGHLFCFSHTLPSNHYYLAACSGSILWVNGLNILLVIPQPFPRLWQLFQHVSLMKQSHFPAWICTYPHTNSTQFFWLLCESLVIFGFTNIRSTFDSINRISTICRLGTFTVHFLLYF